MSDNIIHCVSIRARVTGTGNLQSKLVALDDETYFQNLAPIVLSANTRVLPTRLANIQNQYLELEMYTTEINETVTINKVTLYCKPVAVEYPG